MNPADHEMAEHLADVKRDAVALWRAVAGGDHMAAAVIAANATCAACVAIQAVTLGLVVIADEPSLDNAGYIVLPEVERAELDGFLAALQEDSR